MTGSCDLSTKTCLLQGTGTGICCSLLSVHKYYSSMHLPAVCMVLHVVHVLVVPDFKTV